MDTETRNRMPVRADREGRYNVDRLIEQHGRDGKLTDRVENQIYEN
jgi:hypothetical protein